LADEPGATWGLVVDMHAMGYLDVSQAPMRCMLTGLVLHAASGGVARAVPAEFAARIGGKAARARLEVAELRKWYADAAHCANAGLARYFRADTLPEGTCSAANCRCSTCWADAEVAERGEQLPRVLRAFRTQNPRPASSTAQGRPAAERTLDGHVQALLWDNPRGLMPQMLWRVLRGYDSYFDRQRRRQRRLWPQLLYSRHRGASPGIRPAEVDASLARLQAQRVATPVGGGLWRLQAHIDADAARAARQAARQAAAAATAQSGVAP